MSRRILSRDDLQQAVRVNHYGIHGHLLLIGCTEVRAAQFLEPFLVKLTTLPQGIHLLVNLLGVECSQLLAQLFQSGGRLDMGYQIEHLYLCRGKSNCFHLLRCFTLSAASLRLSESNDACIDCRA